MGRRPALPRQLLLGPFGLAEARRAGLELWHLRGAGWKRLGPATYIAAGLEDTSMHRLQAAALRLPKEAAFSGLTAAWLHGMDVAACDPIEVTIPPGAGVSARSGIAVRRSALQHSDVERLKGLPATSIVRTIADVCGKLSLVEAVAIVDAALNKRRVRLEQLTAWIVANRGRHGISNLRRVLRFAEPLAESPMESRLRMLLVLGGLPRPRAQVAIYDRWRRFVGRPDLYYELQRLGIEYDGAIHRESLAEDDRRQNRLLGAGVRLLRFTARDVLGDSDSVVRQVCEMLNATSAGKRSLRIVTKSTSAGRSMKSVNR